MKKSILIFLLAVLLPSVVLGWLALRSAEEQQIILERRTAELYQKETAAVAEAVRAVVEEQRRGFSEVVRKLLAGEPAAEVARDFSARLASAWPRKAVGFALGGDGKLLAPSAQAARGNEEWQQFLLGNSGFLSGSIPAQVYWVSADELNRPEPLRKSKSGYEGKLAREQTPAVVKALEKDKALPAPAPKPAQEARKPVAASAQKAADSKEPPPMPAPAAAAPATESSRSKSEMPKSRVVELSKKEMAAEPKAAAAATPQLQTVQGADDRQQDQILRNVAPQRVLEDTAGPAVSQLTFATADFPALTAGSNEGVVTRFVQDRLEILFWLRPAQAPEMIFGCLVEAANLRDLWPDALPGREGVRDFVLALLDDKARPVATQPPGETGRDWKRPFVASEIGEVLPHWEAALYLMRPEQLQESARGLRRTLTFLIVAALGAIACGGWLVVADARRQIALAQQKTDFVSNVSHELKTPLTSIRMFAELMQNGADAEKRRQYLRIIMFESERLTRLINNVLDFARIERRQKRYDMRPLDLHALLARTWESHELHLRESGFTAKWDAAPPPYPVIGDADALAQIVVNLLSNAEKYSGERKEVELRTTKESGRICVSVLDRGLGVPDGEERKIFEAFHRAHDSLASGIQGSGLGLTLAQRMAHEHGGEITYAAREGGGSVFTLCVPLAEEIQKPLSS